MAEDVKFQYVWDVRYVDTPALRDENKDPGTDNDCTEAGDERLYYVSDANFNVTALVDAETGEVVERYMYDPYGKATVLNGENGYDADGQVTEWTADAGGSDWANEILYCGYRFDPESGLYHVRHRYYHPTLGRWTTRDPIGYADGYNRYEYARGGPLLGTDPKGLNVFLPPIIIRPGASSDKTAMNSLEAGLTEALYKAWGENNLPPEKGGQDFVHLRDYCCECVPVARRGMSFARDQRNRYMNAPGETAAKVRAAATGDRDLEITGTTHPVKGVKVLYPSKGPCRDLVYQARSEHERSHWDDRNALLLDHSKGFTSTWNSASFTRKTEAKAYGTEAVFYQAFIDECKRQFPEVSF